MQGSYGNFIGDLRNMTTGFLIHHLLLFLLVYFDTAGGEILSTGEDVNDFIDKFISEHDIMVFAKSYCPHCTKSKSIVEELQKDASSQYTWNERFLYLDYMSDDGPIIQAALLEKTGQRTVPNVFIGGQHVGGNSDLTALYESGELQKKIEKIAISKLNI
jgi:glutaredoxin 3